MQKKQNITVILLTLLVLLQTVHTLIFPAAFTVVRNILMPLSIDAFYNKTGCCKNDTNANSASYNIVSLDGYKSTSTLSTLQQSVSPLGIWLNAYSSIAGLKAGRGGNTTATIQSYILDNYHDYGAKLLFNAFADEAPVSQAKADPLLVSQSIINIVQNSQLDGVSIQFSDFHSVSQGTASNWLLQLLTPLRQNLKKKTIVLIIPPTIINRVDILQQPIISGLVDLFVLKYFGYNQPQYTDYNSLFNASTKFPQTAFGQLLKNNNVGVNLCRTVIAKPATASMDGYMSSNALGNAFFTARNNLGWFGGYANLDFQADMSLSFQYQTLQPLRNDCLLQNNCFCM